MLQRVSPAVQHCFDKAMECERLANDASRPEVRDFYRKLRDSWLMAANNHQIMGRVSDYLASQRLG